MLEQLADSGRSSSAPQQRTSSSGDMAEQLRPAPLERAIGRARDALIGAQDASGHWCFELEADCTIPAEYILMMHFMGEIDSELETKLASYIRAHQTDAGGWPLFHGGEYDLSCSVKAYYALKLAGDSPDEPHMRKAREAVMRRGGAVRANVFTHIALAQFAQIPWRAVPFMPVEIILMPRWFPFHLSKVSYWSRTVIVPLLILCSLRAEASNPRGVGIEELFDEPLTRVRDYFPVRSPLNRLYILLDRLGRGLEPLIPTFVRRYALHKAERWIVERLNNEDGLGAIFPAMINAYEALALRGYGDDHPYRQQACRALQRLLVVRAADAYCQPCVSPVWDTALACHALLEENSASSHTAVGYSLDWLAQQQLKDEDGDWKLKAPQLPGGGWAFQFANPHYPDLDDTAAVAWAMHRADPCEYAEPIQRGADWLRGMQSKNGGFGSFDVDNTHRHLNEIPFADHGALLDPPTSDVSARCATLLARLARESDRDALARCMLFLEAEQETSGCWFGRWGTNYIYGTWSVLEALREYAAPAAQSQIARAVMWLESVQHPDGGWGESNASYDDDGPREEHYRSADSTAFQTAWAVLALIAAGRAASDAVARGVEFLLQRQEEDGLWSDPQFTAPGFPRVFYLKYHGYSKYFPLWALARYRNARGGGRR